MTKLLVRVFLPLLAGGALLTGCTSTQEGTASPAQSSSAGEPGSPETSSSSSSSGGSGTASITDPCSLLSMSDLSSYGQFREGVTENLGGARSCRYQKKIASASDKTMVIGANIRDTATVGQLNDQGGGVLDKDINGRQAKEAPETQAVGCTLALPVGNSRVDVLVTAVGSTDEACQIAEAVAKAAVEPRLPKG